MEIVRLGKAIRIRESGEEDGTSHELALALATSMVPRLRRWAAAKAQLDSEIWALESKLEEWRSPLVAGTQGSAEASRIEEERATLEEQLLRLRSEVRNVERRPWRHLRPLWLFIWGSGWRAERDAAKQRLARHEIRLEELSAQLGVEVQEISEALETLRRRRRDLDPIPKVVEGVRELDYVFLPRRVSRGKSGPGKKRVPARWILADPFGGPTGVEVPQVAMSAQELGELEAGLARLDLSAVMLEPGEAATTSGSPRPPFGAEKDLINLAAGLSKFAATTEARSLSVPVVGPHEALVSYLTELFQDAGTVAEQPELDRESSARLAEVRKAADGLGAIVRSNLHAPPELYSTLAAKAKELPALVHQAAADRRRGASAVGRRVEQSRMNAVLLGHHMFCPECNAFPAYLRQTYGITERDVDQLDTARLRSALEELRNRRLDTTEGRGLISGSAERIALEQRWTSAFDELASLEATCEFHRAELRKLERTERPGAAEEKVRREMARREIRMREARYREIVQGLKTRPLALPDDDAEVEASAPQPVNGASSVKGAHPALEPMSRLEYEPAHEETPWSCPRCGTRYETDTALLGAVDRLRTDVVYPMLSGLWGNNAVRSGVLKALEKANQEIEARSREEADALQAPIDTFRSDAGQLRAQVEEAHARGLVASRRLIKVAEQFGEFGLLPPDELEQVRRRADDTVERMSEIVQALSRLAAAERGMEDTIQEGVRARSAPALPQVRFLEEDWARLTPFTDVDGAALGTPPAGRPPGADSSAAATPRSESVRFDTDRSESLRLETDAGGCTFCGSRAPAYAVFCPRCGTTLPRDRRGAASKADRAGEEPSSPTVPPEGGARPSRASTGVQKND